MGARRGTNGRLILAAAVVIGLLIAVGRFEHGTLPAASAPTTTTAGSPVADAPPARAAHVLTRQRLNTGSFTELLAATDTLVVTSVGPFHNEIVGIDPASGRMRWRWQPAPDAVVQAAADGDDVWVADYTHSRLLMLDAATGRQRRSLPFPAQALPADVPAFFAAAFANLWFGAGVGTPDAPGIIRLDPRGDQLRSFRLPLGRPSVLIPAGGSAWIADLEQGALFRVDPASGRLLQQVVVGAGPTPVLPVALAAGRLWVGSELPRPPHVSLTQFEPALLAIDARTGRTALKVVLLAPVDGMAASGSELWLTDVAGTVLSLDAADGRAVGRATAQATGPVAAVDGTLWIAVADGVERIVPPGSRGGDEPRPRTLPSGFRPVT